MLNKFNGSYVLALAAYNGGPGRVHRATRLHQTSDFWQLHSLPRETRNYIPYFLSAAIIARSPEAYGFTIPKNIQPFRYETIELEKSAKMGPVPIDGDVVKLKKRKQLSSVKERNYLLISEEFTSLKQNVSFKFQGLDFKEAMSLMAEIGKINILVGDEVAGAVSAELDNVPWDKAFNALLDLKSYAADIDVASNIIRVSTPANLTSQESYKSARASAVKKKVEIEDSVEPIISEIFRLYYICLLYTSPSPRD